MRFNKPTLVTITSPTASGKSYLLDELVQRGDFSRIVSTTTRDPRANETEGVDYYFITPQKSQEMEDAGDFFELIEFNGTRYGVTHSEMQAKMTSGIAPIVILEPQGLKIYEEKCHQHGWDIFKIYVHVTESVRLDRLLRRTLAEAWNGIDSVATSAVGRHTFTFTEVAIEGAKKRVAKAIGDHHKRLIGLSDERLWSNVTTWDAIVPGDDVEKAISMIQQGVAWRNHRNSVPQAIGAVQLPLKP